MVPFHKHSQSIGALCVGAILLLAGPPSRSHGQRRPEMGWAGEHALGGRLATGNSDRQALANAKFANKTLITGDNQRLKVEDTLSLTSTIIRDSALRASINARYNTNPPGTAVKKVDSLSKVDVDYSF